MKLHFVETMDEVLKIALESPLPELKEETPEALAVVHAPVAAGPASRTSVVDSAIQKDAAAAASFFCQ